MRAVTRPAYLKGVGTRQALRRATTAGRERSRSSSSFRRRLPTESSWLGWPLPTGMCPSVTWLRRTNHDQSSLRAQACDSQCPAPARGCPAPQAARPGLWFPFISRAPSFPVLWEAPRLFLFFFCLFVLFCFFILQVLIRHQFYTHQCIHVNPNRPIQHTTIPTSPQFSPLGVHMSILYICVSTSALQTGSSVPFF